MRFLQCAEMAEGPGDLIAVAFHITLMGLVGTQHLRDVTRYARLFGDTDDQFSLEFRVEGLEIHEDNGLPFLGNKPHLVARLEGKTR